MTAYKVSIINNQAHGMNVYEGDCPQGQAEAIRDVKAVLENLDYSITHEIHSSKNGDVWLDMAIFFLDD